MNNKSFFRLVRGEQVEAQYIEQQLEEYKRNPLIEGLPPILNKEEVFNKIINEPAYSNGERLLKENLRIHCILRLTDYVEPLTTHLDLERRISTMIRRGYVGRNPTSINHLKFINNLSDMKKKHDNSPIEEKLLVLEQRNSFASGFSLIGMSGIGKTTAINRILLTYPQVIYHTRYKDEEFYHYQIVWLKLDCPLDGSLKSFCKSFFKEVDNILGTRYFDKFGSNKTSLDTMVIHMVHIASLHTLGALFIDEIQHLSKAKGGPELMLNFFVTLVNTIGVPVVPIGTFKSFSILQTNFRQARRASGYGEIIWDRMKNDDEWNWFISNMWKYQWTKEESVLTDEIREVIYDETLGITDRAIKLYMLVQWRAISSGKEKITIQLIKKVSKEEMRMTKPMVDALRNNDIDKLHKFDDIFLPDIFQALSKVEHDIKLKGDIEKIRFQQKKISENSLMEVLEKIVLWLIDGGIEAQLAEKSAEKAINKLSYKEELSQLKKEAMALALNTNEKTTSLRTKIKNREAKYAKNDLRQMFMDAEKNKVLVYEILLNEGVIKDPMNEFFGEGLIC
ncbi:ATP-binding protein [Serpentinicella alkaliphila]|nr:ATP-binding protein [Serpentinicella alkaliphila]